MMVQANFCDTFLPTTNSPEREAFKVKLGLYTLKFTYIGYCTVYLLTRDEGLE